MRRGSAIDARRRSSACVSTLRVAFTRKPLGLKLDHNGCVAGVMLDAAESPTKALRCGDQLVGINDTVFVEDDEECVQPDEVVDLLSEYLGADAFPLSLTFRRDGLACRPKDLFERQTLVPARRASEGRRRSRASVDLVCQPKRKKRRTTLAGVETARDDENAPPRPDDDGEPRASATSVTGITGSSAQDVPAIEGLADAAETTAPGRDCVKVLKRIFDARAPKGSEVILRKYAPAAQRLKEGPRKAFLDDCPETLSRAELDAIWARHKKLSSLLPLSKFACASKFQCFLVDTPEALEDYARVKAALEAGPPEAPREEEPPRSPPEERALPPPLEESPLEEASPLEEPSPLEEESPLEAPPDSADPETEPMDCSGFLAPRDEEPASPPREPSPPPLALSPVEERVSATSTVSLEEAGLSLM